MERLGFINEKSEIKVLILYLLRRLPLPIDPESLAELVLIDGGVDYFDYKHCLFELEESSQVEEADGKFTVTAKGARNGEALESIVPFSVRAKADKVLSPVIEEMRRSSMILANHEPCKGGVTTYLALSDGIGNILDLKILASGEEQAKIIEENFKSNAESYYNRIMEMLSEQEK